MDWYWWVIGGVAIVAFLNFLNRRDRKAAEQIQRERDKSIGSSARTEPRQEAARPYGLVVQLHTSTRSYDSGEEHFGGTATPEYRIEYADEDGVVTARNIYLNTWYTRDGVHFLKCWCFLRNERRTFRSDRILSAVNLQTNRRIKDIVAHRMR